MKKKSILIISGIMLCLVTGLSISSCSDDHYEIDSSVASTGTVWGVISSNPDLSEFADILENVYVSTSEDEVTEQTYADMLNHDQTFTVWAPKDGSFDYETWKSMLESGDREQIYKVEVELVRNCITRYRHVLNGDKVEEVLLFNNKPTIFDCNKRTFNGLAIEQYNLGGSNGIIHITNGNATYLPNIYEYLSETEELSHMYEFLKSFDEVIFDEEASTQGPTIDGEVTWVDKVTYLTNKYFYASYMNAYINREDSNYVMIMPTNECWDATYEKMKSYFNYLPLYNQTVVTVSQSDGTSTSDVLVTKFTETELDSIIDFRSNDAVARNLVFNANWQFGHTPEEMRTPGACDSIQSTSGFIFKDPQSTTLFDGQEPVVLSNGLGYVVNNFNYDLKDTWLKEKKIEAEFYNESYSNCNLNYSHIRIENPWDYVDESYKVDENNEPIELPDTVIEVNALTLKPIRATSNPTVIIQAPNTLSCKYDIIAVLVYNTEANLPYQFRAYLNYHESEAKQTRVQVKPIEGVNGTGNYFQTKRPYVDKEGNLQFNDSVMIAKDFNLPVSYYGLKNAYLTIELNAYRTSSQRSQFSNEMIIDKIILIPKEND